MLKLIKGIESFDLWIGSSKIVVGAETSQEDLAKIAKDPTYKHIVEDKKGGTDEGTGK